MTSKKAFSVAAAAAFVVATILTWLALRLLADNNNNGELYDTVTGQWDVAYALTFSAVFCIPSFLISFALVVGLMRLGDRDADGS